MWIKYNEYELLEFFRSLPVFIGSKEAGEFIYASKGENDVEIVMSVSVYEKKCQISLCINDYPIFKASFENVEELQIDDKYETLKICQSGQAKNHIIYNKPNFFITTTESN